MGTQNVNLHITNGGLALTMPSAANTLAVIGCSSAGSTAIVSLQSDINVLRTSYGYGPLVDAAANAIGQDGNTVIVLRVPTTTPGSCGAVTHTGTGAAVLTAAPTTVAGVYDYYEVLITIVTSATFGTGSVQLTYSLDFGATTSAVITLAAVATYAIPGTNITLTWTAATAVAGDTFFFRTIAPLWTSTDISSAGKALDILDASGLRWGAIHCVGIASEAAGAAIEAKMNSLESTYDYSWILLESDDVNYGSSESEAAWMARIEAAWAPFTTTGRVFVAAGNYNVVSAYTSALMRRSLAWPLICRAMASAPSTDMARVMDGPLPNCSLALRSDADTDIYHDERSTPGLDISKFCSMRTIKGKTGPFCFNAQAMVVFGSDYTLLQYRRVMDVVCNTTRDYMLNYLSSNVRLNAATGYILDKEAVKLEGGLTSALQNAVVAPGDASGVLAQISRTDHLNGPGAQMHVVVKVQPLGYLKDIEINLAYAVTLVA